MIYGVILAGGDRRLKESDLPMQYQTVGSKPILLHTVEKFLLYGRIDKILVLCRREWIEKTEALLRESLGRGMERIQVIEGGATRNETIMRAIDFIDESGQLDEDTLIVTHDALRPFVTRRIIEENVAAGLAHGMADTVLPATDTIVCSEDGKNIGSIPERSGMYQGQTPQTFRAERLRQMYRELSAQQRETLTDACKICKLQGETVYMVRGEVFNIKITYPYDLQVARSLLEEQCQSHKSAKVTNVTK